MERCMKICFCSHTAHNPRWLTLLLLDMLLWLSHRSMQEVELCPLCSVQTNQIGTIPTCTQIDATGLYTLSSSDNIKKSSAW